ncbi:Similar to S.cerevisiae protein ATX2 (Golgi membrane protein involved in manganese homeostasis) [Malassezia sympodialis ATCC 42132]|uniref:Similar to S.cerevisiae protein ATX2 (Golgi membrane protein involved in manganese homeostasis) n=1 Tax=Malassezia sympodialis (strain ATCC 42132) TaxID=1230383 RepID=A0A1M8ABT4_MALS4|nr:Similar to S.cerevisiae protein ATX2 (Golgi membrane protein involved in manganese homeostasis) [Malassezia sympodialis ATCC 42132]
MRDGIWLLAVGCALAAGTYAVGTLPLVFRLSRCSLRKLELWGAGLLLGAALTVVIPEGISNVYRGRMCRDEPMNETHLLQSKDLVAFCLLSGFLLMFAVDQHMVAQSHARSHDALAPADEEEMRSGGAGAGAGPMTWDPTTRPGSPSSLRQVLGSLLGILVHAAADGVAMGSSVESTNQSLRLVIMLAVMVHKAPASIGICTLLMSRQLRRAEIRWAVLAFSVTTPLSALLTYGVLQVLLPTTGTTSDSMDTRKIGAILSFSGGTFLYVAIHAVTELASPSAGAHLAHHSDHVHHPHDHDHPIHAQTGEAVLGAASSSISRFFRGSHEAETQAGPSPPFGLLYVVVGSVVPRLLQLLIGDVHP